MRIRELILYSSQLGKQANFYSGVLGLEIIDQKGSSVSFKVGESTLKLEHRDQTTPYHFAINIPSNKENEALVWLKSKVDVLREGENEIHDFNFWNAKTMYFYDNDHNIVELIARKNLNNESEQKFDSGSFLEISEIGFPTTNIKDEFEYLKEWTDIEIYSGSFERFCAIGDEHGLFICVDKNKKDVWFPTNDKIISSDFCVHFTQKGVDHHIEFKDGKLNKSSK